MTHTTDEFAPFKPFRLSKGAHDDPQGGMCVMEMASWLAGEEWTDRPDCVCPILATVCRVANDNMSQPQRDRLQTYLPRLIGSVDPASERARADIFVDWMWVDVLPALKPRADEYGFGAEWAEMCVQKTEAAAEAARVTAARAAEWAARAAAWDAEATARAVAWAVDAARAAGDAADAARAVDAARAAGDAADAARAAVWVAVWAAVWADAGDSLFSALEAAIAAGKHGDDYTVQHVERARDLHMAMETAS